MKNIIYQFIRSRKGHHVGCVAAIGRHAIGWSLCNIRDGDKFDKKIALHNALSRAQWSPVCTIVDVNWPKSGKLSVPHSVRPTMRRFIVNRVERYFKTKSVKKTLPTIVKRNIKASVIKRIIRRSVLRNPYKGGLISN